MIIKWILPIPDRTKSSDIAGWFLIAEVGEKWIKLVCSYTTNRMPQTFGSPPLALNPLKIFYCSPDNILNHHYEPKAPPGLFAASPTLSSCPIPLVLQPPQLLPILQTAVRWLPLVRIFPWSPNTYRLGSPDMLS